VLATLRVRGWALTTQPISEAEYEQLAQELGTIELRTDIKVDPEKDQKQRAARLPAAQNRPSVYQSGELEFHTDRPTVDILGWYCVAQDDDGGENLLIDTSDLPKHFRDNELEELGKIKVAHFVTDQHGHESKQHAPLVARGPEGWRVFFVPWNLVAPEEEWRRSLLDGFIRYVDQKVQRDVLRLRLLPGQCLFISNLRMLHGRGSLPAGSRRHLIRYYIRSHSGEPAVGR
jgi:alpha-ketoglutarate-dependent taurine dioxygenase